MWILFAFGSALFAGLTSILAKCGIRKTDSDTATAIQTIVVLLFSWLMVAIVGSAPTITGLSAKTWVFLILSGLATGASWLCYFRALQLGELCRRFRIGLLLGLLAKRLCLLEGGRCGLGFGIRLGLCLLELDLLLLQRSLSFIEGLHGFDV